MLDELINRKDVSELLVEICNSARYYDKKSSSSMGYKMYSGAEQILFLFYDALYKYKMIIEDMDFFDDFLEQIDKLMRKIDNFKDISYGINRIIGRICAFKLGDKDIDSEEVKEKVLRYIYERYIIDGYYIHGYSGCYYESIKKDGFLVEQYNNLYPKFIGIKKILEEKKYENVLDKDFSVREVAFTDSFLLGCYYSVNSPMYFSSLLCRNEFVNKDSMVDAYSMNDYDLCMRNLYRLINKLDLNDYERALFVDAFKSEWKLLNKSNSKISLMLVPRKILGNDFDIEKFIISNRESDFVEAVCKMLGQRSEVITSDNIERENIKFINLNSYKFYLKDEKKDSLAVEFEKTFITSDDEFAFSNTYGKVSILLLLGTMFITIGVILTIIAFS